jgi:hypothetical protein
MYGQTYQLECAPGLCGRLRRRYPDGSICCDTCGKLVDVDLEVRSQYVMSSLRAAIEEHRSRRRQKILWLVFLGFGCLVWMGPAGLVIVAMMATLWLFYKISSWTSSSTTTMDESIVPRALVYQEEKPQSREAVLATGD